MCSIYKRMQWEATLLNNHVNDRASKSTGEACIVPELVIQLKNLNCIHIYRYIMKPCMQINSAIHSIAVTVQRGWFLLRVGVSRKTERCNQWGHSPWLPDAGLGASESEGSPSKNVSSNFRKVDSFGDAICLSIARGPHAQVRLSSCSRHVSSLLIHRSPHRPVLFHLRWSEIYLHADIQHTGLFNELHWKWWLECSASTKILW